jgi:hypothetical protein
MAKGSLVETTPVGIAACDCITPFGDAAATHAALLRGEKAVRATPVLGSQGGDPVPLALLPGRALDETVPPSVLGSLRRLAARIPGEGWGSARRPVFVSSSNFGVGNLLEFRRHGDTAHLPFGSPFGCVGWLCEHLGWGPAVHIFSHACVSAHLGLLQATRMLHAGLVDDALVFSFDTLSPFVSGGFHALKILNDGFPAPYQDRPTGAIGLGDGAAFAVLTRGPADFSISAQCGFNELAHFTANRADGSGFAACFGPIAEAADGMRVWCKGHGTGTLEAGRLESAACARFFPDAPLVGWKGSLGHTLGSCGLVELALVAAAFRDGRTPGTVGTVAPTFTDAVATAPFSNADFDGAFCASNAFGGAHAAIIVRHV